MLLIQSINALNEYLNGVMNRANHHAQNVNEVALTIAGAIVWRATEDIHVRTVIITGVRGIYYGSM